MKSLIELTEEQLKQVIGGVTEPVQEEEAPEGEVKKETGGCIPPIFNPFGG